MTLLLFVGWSGWGAGAAKAACTPSDTTLCLRQARFSITVAWRDFESRTGLARVVDTAPVTSDTSGLFWFFRPTNWELLVKVIVGCTVNQHFWVFAAATTNLEFDIEVTDHTTGQERTYHNALGQSADAITDTSALPCSAPPAP